MYENFGDLGVNIKKFVDEFKVKVKSNQNIQFVCKFDIVFFL